MTKYLALLCSIQLLIVLLSCSDGLWHDERWNVGRWNDERRNSARRYGKRWSGERWDDERWNNERRYDERRNHGRQKDEGRIDERLNVNRRNDERRNDNARNDERRNENGRNDERRNENGRNDERQNENARNDERRNENGRNYERRNENERNDERRNENGRNDERRNENGRNERRNENRRNDKRRNDNKNEEDRLLSFVEICPADKREDWSYRGNNGPLTWTRRYPTCGELTQSPVAINYYEVTFKADIEKLKFNNYQIPIERATFENNGHTIRVTPRDDVQRNILFDSKTYRLRALHFHWGEDKSQGSEHTINFIQYALEMHLVHQSGTGQTAVVAVIFREQSQRSKELQNIIQNFPKLLYKDHRTESKLPLNLNNLLPENPATYFWYEGSLTTPPCTEGVQWLVLREMMPVGTKQMAEFRKLYSSSKADSNEHCKISNNYRPLQSRYGRKVVVSQ